MDIKNKIKEELDSIHANDSVVILNNFHYFKKHLAKKIELGESMGLSEEKLAKTTELVANYLAKHETPKNREEKVLMELWNVGTKEEQRALSHMMLKMVKQSPV